jgi:hypothetical protein
LAQTRSTGAKPGSKLHLLTEGQGLPLVPALTAANTPDGVLLATVVEEIPPVATPAGRRRTRPGKLHTTRPMTAMPTCPICADGGSLHASPGESGVINQAGSAPLKIERSLSWLSCYRRLQVRWERDSGRFFAFVLLACALVCFSGCSRS